MYAACRLGEHLPIEDITNGMQCYELTAAGWVSSLRQACDKLQRRLRISPPDLQCAILHRTRCLCRMLLHTLARSAICNDWLRLKLQSLGIDACMTASITARACRACLSILLTHLHLNLILIMQSGTAAAA